MFAVGDLNNNLFSCFISRVTAVGASLIPGKSLAARIFSAAGGRRGCEEGGWAGGGRVGDEDVLTTGNLVVLQLEFPFSPPVVFFFFLLVFFFLFAFMSPWKEFFYLFFCCGNKDAAVG